MAEAKREEIIELLNEQQVSRAREKLDEYADTVGRDDFYHCALADIWSLEGSYMEVIGFLLEYLPSAQSQNLLYARLGEAYFEMEDFDSALMWLEKAEPYDHDEEMGNLFLMGKCWLLKSDFRRAARCFEDILLEEEDDNTRYLAACSWLRAGRTSRADEYFDRLADKPEFTARICFELAFADDEQLMQKYTVRIPDEAQRLYSWTHYYLLRDRVQEAEKALDDYDGRRGPGFYNNMGELWNMAHHRKQARAHWRSALSASLDDNVETLGQIAAKLEALQSLGYSEGHQDRTVLRIFRETRGMDRDCLFLLLDYCDINNLDHAMFTIAWKGEFGELDEVLQRALVGYQLQSAFNTKHYEKAWLILSDYPYEKNRSLDKYLAIAALHTGRYEQAARVARTLMPDGQMAVVLFYCLSRERRYADAIQVCNQMDGLLAETAAPASIEDEEVYRRFRRDLDEDPSFLAWSGS